MDLYKFRSLAQLDRVADILVSERLFCSRYSHLNDPFEGQYIQTGVFRSDDGHSTVRISTPSEVGDLRAPENPTELLICSLSSALDDVRMWSHYADSHRGVAIEVSFDEVCARPRQVQYVERLPTYSFDAPTSPRPEEVLTTKTTHWAYEKEYRFFHNATFLPIRDRIRRVILGARCRDTDETVIRRLLPSGARIVRTRLDPMTSKVVLR